ncbi:MAG: oligosaccharide flippase family protein [Firmicutes bacterium]|nr:oligosaccharide flippase family protein [Bacillota bacterium]
MAGETVARGTAVLTAAGLVSRAIGLVYRIYLVRLVGAEAIGLFQIIFPLYWVALLLGSLGVPTAVAKLVADYQALGDTPRIARVMRWSFALVAAASLFWSVLLLWSVPFLSAQVLSDPRTAPALWVVAPSLPAVAIAAVLRGYFEGRQQMTALALLQVAEQLVHVGVTLGLVLLVPGADARALAVVLAAGSVASDVAGLLILGLGMWPRYRPPAVRGPFPRPWPLASPFPGGTGVAGTGSAAGQGMVRRASAASARPAPAAPASVWRFWHQSVLRRILTLAVPAAAGRLVISLSSTVSALLVPRGLQAAGFTVSQATTIYGEISGMALNLAFLPTIFTSSLATNMVPAAARAALRGPAELQHFAERALKLTTLVCLPMTAALTFFGPDLGVLFFASERAGLITQALALPIFVTYWQQVSTGILQGSGHPGLPLVASGAATTAGAILVYLLVPRPNLGLNGAILALSISYLLGGLLSLTFVQLKTRAGINVLKHVFPVALAAFGAGGLTHRLCLWFWPAAAQGPAALARTAVGLLCMAGLYMAATWLLGLWTRENWQVLGFGGKPVTTRR